MTVGLPETDQRGHARKQYRGVQEQGTAWRQQQAIEAGHAVPRVVANVDHVAKPYPVVRCPDHAARHDSWGHEPNPARQFLAVAVRFEDKPEDDRYHRQQELVPDEPPRAQEPASQNQRSRLHVRRRGKVRLRTHLTEPKMRRSWTSRTAWAVLWASCATLARHGVLCSGSRCWATTTPTGAIGAGRRKARGWCWRTSVSQSVGTTGHFFRLYLRPWYPGSGHNQRIL